MCCRSRRLQRDAATLIHGIATTLAKVVLDSVQAQAVIVVLIHANADGSIAIESGAMGFELPHTHMPFDPALRSFLDGVRADLVARIEAFDEATAELLGGHRYKPE